MSSPGRCLPAGLLTQATENSTSDMSATTRYLRLSLTDNDASLIELVFLDANGNITRPLNADAYPYTV